MTRDDLAALGFRPDRHSDAMLYRLPVGEAHDLVAEPDGSLGVQRTDDTDGTAVEYLSLAPAGRTLADVRAVLRGLGVPPAEGTATNG